ncbi:T3SS (YopN, CesT) and YbjN peptide-binding chaperone 1 [Nocardioides sp. TRM66260-LWL]|uniref:T3SS (YopN, CesT) and YbjN peptide-binding chaperone 1 n=1 Tax=Nocardioides sp. TRM66260-LWL TaxID=2874478 RepID=UPI0035B1A541
MEAQVAAAWSLLARRIAAEMARDDRRPVVHLRHGDDVGAPLLRVHRLEQPEPLVVAELLAPVGPVAVELLDALGWEPPERQVDEPGEGLRLWSIAVELADPARPHGVVHWLEEQVLPLLPDAFGVPHPAFLRAAGVALDGLRRPEPRRLEARRRLHGGEVFPAVVPNDADDLRALVDAALRDFLGYEPVHDDDGDAQVPVGTTLVWVRVDPDEPWIELFSYVVADLPHPHLARAALPGLAADVPWARLVVDGDDLLAVHRLWAAPFSDRQLHAMLAHFHDVDALGDVLVGRWGGRRFLDAWLGLQVVAGSEHPEPDPADATQEADPVSGSLPVADPADADAGASAPPPVGDLRPELEALAGLLRRGPVPPRTVAAIFDHRVDAVLRAVADVRDSEVLVPTEIERMVASLGLALRLIEAEGPEAASSGRAPRSVQLSLLGDEPGLEEWWDDDAS